MCCHRSWCIIGQVQIGLTAPIHDTIHTYTAASLTPPNITCTVTDVNHSTSRIYKFFSTSGKVAIGSDPDDEASGYWDAHLNYTRDTGADGIADGDKAGVIFTASSPSFTWATAPIGTQWIGALMKDAWTGRTDSGAEAAITGTTVIGNAGGKENIDIDLSAQSGPTIDINETKIHVVGAIACIFDGTDIWRKGTGNITTGSTTFHVGGQCRPEGLYSDGDTKNWGTGHSTPDNDDELNYLLESSDTGAFGGEEIIEFDTDSNSIVYKIGEETNGTGSSVTPAFTTRAITKSVTLSAATTKYYQLTVSKGATNIQITFNVTVP